MLAKHARTRREPNILDVVAYVHRKFLPPILLRQWFLFTGSTIENRNEQWTKKIHNREIVETGTGQKFRGYNRSYIRTCIKKLGIFALKILFMGNR